jgi:hypothetical protein
MIYTIDGMPVPQIGGGPHSKMMPNYIPFARFILDNLKPDSVIGYFDFEGFSQAPTYDSLMTFARYILPDYVPPQRYRGTLEMRQACARLCNRVLVTKAQYITEKVYEEIKAAWEKKRIERSRMYPLKGKPWLTLDSIPDFKLEHA